MTVSLAAVFIPLVFMGGIIGRLLHEFAVTIVLAIAVLRRRVGHADADAVRADAASRSTHRKHNRFYEWSENTFNRVQACYERSLRWSLEHRFVIFARLPRQHRGHGRHVHDHAAGLPARRATRARSSASPKRANGTSFDQMVRYQQQAAAIVAQGSQCRRASCPPSAPAARAPASTAAASSRA